MNVIFKEVLYLIMSLEQAPCKLKHADTSATGRERCCDMLLNALLAVIDAWNRYDIGVSEYSSSTTEITYRCLEFMGGSPNRIFESISTQKNSREVTIGWFGGWYVNYYFVGLRAHGTPSWLVRAPNYGG